MVESVPEISTDWSHGICTMLPSAMWALKTLHLSSCTIGQTLILVHVKQKQGQTC